jgi:S-adenosylmethionine:tRNA ribosyltransferase-isomerase
MRVDELDYDLPAALIAKQPPPEREQARLLVLARAQPSASANALPLRHHAIAELPALLPRALFVFNDTRVIPARLIGHKPSGGRFELLLVERLAVDAAATGADVHGVAGEPGGAERWLCMARPLKGLKPGLSLALGPLTIRIGPRRDQGLLEVALSAPQGVDAALAEVGQIPLPPYLGRPAGAEDVTRYQTLFARQPGAVAAPTAGLHFGEALLAALARAGHETAFVTLHVGPGTFAPLAVDDIASHPMHEEAYELPAATVAAIARAKREGRPVVAVGTTVVRTLEAVAREHGELAPGAGRTRICIYPPFDFRVVDALVTNFHLPRSTLLALVMAFAGSAVTRAAYQAAIAARYRFFSYGDAMLIASESHLESAGPLTAAGRP